MSENALETASDRAKARASRKAIRAESTGRNLAPKVHLMSADTQFGFNLAGEQGEKYPTLYRGRLDYLPRQNDYFHFPMSKTILLIKSVTFGFSTSSNKRQEIFIHLTNIPAN